MTIDDPGAGTFADVLNGFTLGGGRKHHRREPAAERPSTTTRPGQEMVKRIDWTWPDPRPGRTRPEDDPDGEFAGDAAIVRPYAWTRGRTKSKVDLRIEAMVSTSELGEDIEGMTQTEHRSIAALCVEPRSVAEVATLLAVPLGVAKVLLGDMAGLGLVIVHRTATGGANKAHLMLMERVLSGLRRL